MEWDPEGRDAWVADAQRWIGQIKGVLQSKIELDDDGEIQGIHVVAGFDREPRHIVRDVESLLKARLGIDVFYKKIGVVQVLENDEAPAGPLPDGPGVPKEAGPPPEAEAGPHPAKAAAAPGGVTFHPPEDEAGPSPEADHPGRRPQGAPHTPDAPAAPEPERPPIPAVLVAEDLPPRILCAGVGVLVSESLVRAEVQLQAGELAVRGTREGPNHPRSDVALIAEATLEAVGKLLAAEVLLHVHEITTTRLGGQEVVLAAVNLVEGRRSEILFGTCGADHNRQQAVVFAVLDALNRRLSQYPLQDAAQE